jgi:hypothetical protein
MNDLQRFFEANEGPLINKFAHYFEVYERHFSPFRNLPVNVLEVGVYQGGSLQMWKHYFGAQARIFGLDINPHCKSLEDERIQIFIANQEDRMELKRVAEQLPQIDILIDDGGHLPKQQINTFEVFYPRLSENGIYLCEDLHSAYLKNHKGGYKKRTFIEYSKDLIDQLNAWHSEDNRLRVNSFTRSTFGLHYYESMLVIEKRLIVEPSSKRTGKMMVPDMPPSSLMERARRKLTVIANNIKYHD